MCVAIAQRKDAAPLTKEELKRGWQANPDGAGYAFIDPKTNKILIRKFMSRKPFIKAYLRDHKAHGAKSPFIVHMRIATHGKIMEDTAHPFRINADNGEIVFAHNGIINSMIPYSTPETSDTMAFRDLFLDDMPDEWLDNMAIRELVESYVEWSKLVFLTTSDRCSDNLYIINETDGFWKKDTWYSNKSCQPKVPSQWSYGKKVETKVVKDTDNWFNSYGWDNGELPNQTTPPVCDDPSMSFVVRDAMNGLLIGTGVDILIESATAQGFCKFCLFDPCMCVDTCYYCNNRQVICKCDLFMSIDDMRGWVGESYFMECRQRELEIEYEKVWDGVEDYTPHSTRVEGAQRDTT